MKIVINATYGGFSLSEAAFKELGIPWGGYGYAELERDDPRLIAVVEKLGAEANGSYASLKVVEIPNGTSWEIEEYDGSEWISEKHAVWR